MLLKREGRPRPGIKVVGGILLLLSIAAILGGCAWIHDWLNPNQAPTAVITANPTSGEAPLEVTFDASESYDPDGDGISYEWDFGDGQTEVGQAVQHSFSTPKNHTVELTVLDNKGASGTSAVSIAVFQRSSTDYTGDQGVKVETDSGASVTCASGSLAPGTPITIAETEPSTEQFIANATPVGNAVVVEIPANELLSPSALLHSAQNSLTESQASEKGIIIELPINDIPPFTMVQVVISLQSQHSQPSGMHTLSFASNVKTLYVGIGNHVESGARKVKINVARALDKAKLKIGETKQDLENAFITIKASLISLRETFEGFESWLLDKTGELLARQIRRFPNQQIVPSISVMLDVKASKNPEFGINPDSAFPNPLPAKGQIALVLIHGFQVRKGQGISMDDLENLAKDKWASLASKLSPIATSSKSDNKPYRIYAFVYDSFRHVAENGKDLATWLSYFTRNGNKIVIVAHSMGGLVARSAIEEYGAQGVARLITLGTPHRGTPLAARDFIEYVVNKGELLTMPLDVATGGGGVREFYEKQALKLLLALLQTNGGDDCRWDEEGIPGFNGNDWLHQLNAQAASRKPSDTVYSLYASKSLPPGLPQGSIVDQTFLLLRDEILDAFTGSAGNDGTVPYASAIWPETFLNPGEVQVHTLEGVDHSNLIKEDSILNSLYEEINSLIPKSTNDAPSANAGFAQTVPIDTLVTLDGSESSDPDGDDLTYHWEQIDGPKINLTADPNNPKATFSPTEPGTYKFKLVVNDGKVDSKPAYVTITVEGEGNNTAVPTQILSPIIGPLEVVNTLSACSNTKWCFNQHKTGGHCPGGGICRADDTYAWDINLNYPNWNSDGGKPVYAVASGVVANTYGGCLNAGGSYGQILLEHTHQDSKWWSGYLHMSNIQVHPGQTVTKNTLLGYTSHVGADNDHLHFVVYVGSNTRGGLVSFNATIIARGTTTPTPSPPTLTSPDGQSAPGEKINTLTPTFRWNGASNADSYGLYIRDLGTNNLVFNSKERNIQIAGTSYKLPAGVLEWGKHYRWNMNSHNSAGWGDTYSNALYFQTQEITPSQPVAKITSYDVTPRQTQVGQSITLTMAIKNTGNTSQTFYGAVSLRKPDGTEVDSDPRPISLDKGQEESLSWAYTPDVGGKWDVAFGVWKDSSQASGTDLDTTDWLNGFITVTYNPPSPSLAFTSLSPATITTGASTYIALLKASGTNFNNVTRITFSWSGPDSGSVAWNKGDSNWNAAVTVNSDSSMTLRPTVLHNASSTHSETWNWTVTLKDNTGATASQSFTVTYNPSNVTLTLYVHEGSSSGPLIVGARVQGHDGAGSPFNMTTTSSGYVQITGQPGSWHFTASKSGYQSVTWDQSITTTCRRDASIPPPSPTLTFTALTPSTMTTGASTYIALLKASGTNFNNVTRITFSWSGPDSGSVAWNKGDSNWNAAVTVNSDSSMTLRPTVLHNASSTHSETWNWTVTLKDNTGATASQSFTVTYNPSNVTLTLYVHEGSSSGPLIVGARVQGHDGAGSPFNMTTTSSGYVQITGQPGSWHFTASKSGYQSVTWDQSITTTCRRDASLPRDQPPQLSPPVPTSPGSTSSPGPQVSALTPTFQWNGVSGAESYGLYISEHPYGSSHLVYTNNGISGGQASLSLPSGVLRQGKKYCWNMRAYNSAGWSGYSRVLYFQIPQPQPTVITVTVTDSSPKFQKGSYSGHPQYWKTYTHQGHTYIYTYTAGNTADCWAQFRPYLPQAGEYEVYACFFADPQNSRSVPYTIYHAGGSVTIRVDEYAANYFTWREVRLGSWNFGTGTDTRVVVTDATGESYDGSTTLNVDTMKFVGQ